MASVRKARFRRGDLVQVCSEQEILETLAPDGTFEGLPFMPEMALSCGKIFRVARRAEKTCVEGCGIRRIQNTVLLESVRCDGRFHDGCQRRCWIFWKEAWLKPAEPAALPESPADPVCHGPKQAWPTERHNRYWCQSTQLESATGPLPWWDLRQYLRDLLAGEATLWELIHQGWLLVSNRLKRLLGTWKVHGPSSGPARSVSRPLDLQIGELVEIKSLAEIEATLDCSGKNLGLEFSPDMAQYCGGKYRVAQRVEKIILECSGQMRPIRDTVILENLVCNGKHARNCPRANYYYWREAWLQRVGSPDGQSSADADSRQALVQVALASPHGQP